MLLFTLKFVQGMVSCKFLSWLFKLHWWVVTYSGCAQCVARLEMCSWWNAMFPIVHTYNGCMFHLFHQFRMLLARVPDLIDWSCVKQIQRNQVAWMCVGSNLSSVVSLRRKLLGWASTLIQPKSGGQPRLKVEFIAGIEKKLCLEVGFHNQLVFAVDTRFDWQVYLFGASENELHIQRLWGRSVSSNGWTEFEE